MRTKAELIAAISADQQCWRDLSAEVGTEHVPSARACLDAS